MPSTGTRRMALITAFIAQEFADVALPGHTYPRELPDPLVPWYVYAVDGGHSILVVAPPCLTTDAAPGMFVAPVPVRTMLRGWQELHRPDRPDDEFAPYIEVPGLRYDPDMGFAGLGEDEERDPPPTAPQY